MNVPRVLIAGLRGGSGKTIVSLGLAAAWHRRGQRVAPFKKGPDYIDAAWLSAAAGRPCRNLDLFLMPPEAARTSFVSTACDADVAVIEGNRGLFDGMDAEGSYSTAELAKLLQVPVLLVVDCTKATRSVAAVVLGCQRLDPEVPLRGVILNQMAGPRHAAVVREAIQRVCGLPVVGCVARIRDPLLAERHLGLVPPPEHGGRACAVEQAADLAERYLDLPAIRRLAGTAPRLDDPSAAPEEEVASSSVRIGVFRDAAFQFYYPENLEALKRAGAEVVEISPIRATEVPKVDALYIGGGFPETQASALSSNRSFRASLRGVIERGLPVYAECGGAVYLGETLRYERQSYPMAGVFPAVFGFQRKPQGHGYVEMKTVRANPFYGVGQAVRGHEFHYTYLDAATADDLTFAFRVGRGQGFGDHRDGLCRRNVLALYTHVHALGTPRWAPALVAAAVRFKSQT